MLNLLIVNNFYIHLLINYMYIYTMGKVKKMISAKLDLDLIKKIDRKAKTDKRTRHYLIVQALEEKFGK